MELAPEDISRLRIALKKVHFLENLKFHEMDILIGALQKKSFKKGETIIKQGEKGEHFYIISSGLIGIYRSKLFGKDRIAQRTVGEFIGEMALLKNEPRNASAIGEEDGEIFSLSKSDFDAILLHNPSIAAMIRTASAHRISEN